MSIQIFQDSENIPGLGKKNKRGDENGMKTNIPKPTKRVALGNITNQVHGSRIQPSRAAKEKHKVCLRFGGLSLTYFCHRTCLGANFKNFLPLRANHGQPSGDT